MLALVDLLLARLLCADTPDSRDAPAEPDGELAALGVRAEVCRVFAASAFAHLATPLVRHVGTRAVRALCDHPVMRLLEPDAVGMLCDSLDSIHRRFLEVRMDEKPLAMSP